MVLTVTKSNVVQIVAWMVLTCAAMANAQESPVDSVPPPTAASNQSLSIAPESEQGPPANVIESTSESSDPALPVASETKSPVESSPAGSVKSRQRAPRRTLAAGSTRSDAALEPTPWYRTGLGALVVVLGLIGLLYVFLRRFVPAARAPVESSIRVVGRAALGPRQSLALVRVGRRLVLLGVSSDRVDRVCEITDSDEVAELMIQSGAPSGSGPSLFANWLHHESRDYGRSLQDEDSNVAEPSDSRRGPATPVRELLQRLRKVRSS